MMIGLLRRRQSGEGKQTVCAIVVAAGQSSRMGTEGSKQFIEINQKPVLAYTLEALSQAPSIDEIVTVARECDVLMVFDIIKAYDIAKATKVVPGGDSRQQSVQKGLDVAGEADWVVIHDGARPCVLPQQVEQVIAAAQGNHGAVLGCRVNDTLKQVNEQGVVTGTVDRAGLWQVQTPQVFQAEAIRLAYQTANTDGATDDCMLMEQMGGTVVMVEGTSDNIKITTQSDVSVAQGILEQQLLLYGRL